MLYSHKAGFRPSPLNHNRLFLPFRSFYNHDMVILALPHKLPSGLAKITPINWSLKRRGKCPATPRTKGGCARPKRKQDLKKRVWTRTSHVKSVAEFIGPGAGSTDINEPTLTTFILNQRKRLEEALELDVQNLRDCNSLQLIKLGYILSCI
jgi:hypothetical protein